MKIKNRRLAIYDVSNVYRDYMRGCDKRISMKKGRRYYGILVTKEMKMITAFHSLHK